MLPIVLCLLSLFAVGVSKAAPSPTSEDAWCKTEVLPKAVQEFSQYMDRTVKPCDDFYQFVCGNSSVNVKEVLEARIKEFSTKFHQQKVDKNSDSNDVKNKARLHYQNCMDWDTRRERGVKPLLEYIKAVVGFDPIKQELVAGNFDWIEVVAKLALEGAAPLFLVFYEKEIITFYKEPSLHKYNKSEINDVLIETGMNATVASLVTEEVLEFATDLVNLKTDPERPIKQIFNFEELKSEIPDIDWEKYFKTTNGHLPSQQILVYSPSYFYSLQKKLQQTSPKTIANYIFVCVILATELNLDGRYNKITSNFANPDGKKFDPDPEYWCRRLASYWIPDAVDSAYVREFFGGNNKIEATELVDYLKRAFVENDWSDAKIKEDISKKFEKMGFEVGYPDYLLSDEAINERFKNLEIVPGKHYESQQNTVRNHKLMSRKGLITTWVSPLYVHVYGGMKYGMEIPAAQFQPPFYHHCYPKVLNFGAVGTLIAKGIARVVGETPSCSASSLNKWVPDTNSVRLAYKAYIDWVKENLLTENLVLPEFPDLNDKQLFFIAYAHGWCGSGEHETEQLIRNALSKLSEFAAVFRCPLGSNMNPEKNAVLACEVHL